MSDETFRILDFLVRLLTLIVATFGSWKIFHELRVMNRKRPILRPILRAGLGEASVELLNITGKPIIITEAAFRFLSMAGEEGITPYFTSLERDEKLPLKLDDGASFTIMEQIKEGDKIQFNLNCVLAGTEFQWAATIKGHLSARNTYAEVSPPTLIVLNSPSSR